MFLEVVNAVDTAFEIPTPTPKPSTSKTSKSRSDSLLLTCDEFFEMKTAQKQEKEEQAKLKVERKRLREEKLKIKEEKTKQTKKTKSIVKTESKIVSNLQNVICKCPVCGALFEDGTGLWIQCDACALWMHVKCVPKGIDVSGAVDKKKNFICHMH